MISKAEKEVDNESPTKLFKNEEVSAGSKMKGNAAKKTDLSHGGRKDIDDYEPEERDEMEEVNDH